jgi:hypothetical protein
MAEDGARQLAIYLNDHLAGSTTAVELLRRAVGEYAGTPLGEFLAALRAEILQDRDELKSIMAANGVAQQRYKVAAAWVAEKATRLKFNGALIRRSPMTPFVELETLAIGIRGKELLWRALRELAPDEATANRLDELIARARRQQDDVERHRLEAGTGALRPARVP